MRKFLINVNGNSYEVEVEELAGGASAPVAAPVQTAAPVAAPKAAPAPAAPAGGTTVSAPMPGNIFDVKVAAGQQVKEGDILIILEAMKMENEILAPCDGKVVSVAVSKGATVGTGDVLVTLG